jgi:hypothetical protein
MNLNLILFIVHILFYKKILKRNNESNSYVDDELLCFVTVLVIKFLFFPFQID